MKPRYRFRASGAFEFLTHDGYVPFTSLGHSGLRADRPTTGDRMSSNQGSTLSFGEFLPRLPVVAGGINRPSVPVSGSRARPLSVRGAPRLTPLHEGQIVIRLAEGSPLPAFGPSLTIPKRHHLPGGAIPHRAFSSFKQNNHVVLSSEDETATPRFAKVRNVHG